MRNLITVVVASALALGSVSSFAAADSTKGPEAITQSERADMRARAERLRAERFQGQPQERAAAVRSPMAKQDPPLTAEERMELRNRAERLMAERDRRRP